jgi:hypothetical protein
MNSLDDYFQISEDLKSAKIHEMCWLLYNLLFNLINKECLTDDEVQELRKAKNIIGVIYKKYLSEVFEDDMF